jgi:hypothetical protein
MKSMKEKAMNPQTNPALKITNRIARRRERIARWDKEADEVESSWAGGPEYRRFCEAMAGAAREKLAELEAELKLEQAIDWGPPRKFGHDLRPGLLHHRKDGDWSLPV